MTDIERERRLRFMNGLIHRAAGNDKKHEGKALEWLDQPDRPDLRLTLTPQQNTALHIAVSFNKKDLARKIIELYPSLVYESNSKGHIPLHIAANAGHLHLARLLTGEAGAPGDLEERTSQRMPGEMLRKTNLEGNTPLHEALKMGHEEMALFLLDLVEEQELGGIVNYAKESPLHLAVAASLKPVVLKLLERREHCSIEGPDGQTPLHSAVINGRSKRGLEIVEILLRKFGRGDIERVDHFGKTALHYAAALGRRANLEALVSANPSLVYVADNDGNLPLHIIVKDGRQFPMVKYILSSNACAAEVLDRKGRNALHVAVMNDNLPMLKFLLKFPELKVLINEPDSDGNTPLHLAVESHFLLIVIELLVHGARGRITNKKGLTPWDVNDFDEEIYFKRVLFRAALNRFGAVDSPIVLVKRMALRPRRVSVLLGSDSRSLANILIVVAALIAAVTFAAPFTFPGGYKNNDPGEGLPVLIKRAALKAFVISDIVAFCSSLTVAFLMVYTLVGEEAFLETAVVLSLYLLWVAFSGTAVALASALYVVLSNESLWLAIVVVCAVCSVPLLVMAVVHISWYHAYRLFVASPARE